MPRNAGNPKTESLGFRIDAELASMIDESVRCGKFSSKSEVAIRALTQYFERERCIAEIKSELCRLIKTDQDVIDLIRQCTLSLSITG